jgi:hypothetical protein
MEVNHLDVLVPSLNQGTDETLYLWMEANLCKLTKDKSQKKRALSIGIELFQNILKFRDEKHLSLIRFRKEGENRILISAINYTHSDHAERLGLKFEKLDQSENLREDFRYKLARRWKIQGENLGDFGLDFCFRFSSSHRLRRLTTASGDELVVLTFQLN